MHNTEQTLPTAIGELRCIDPEHRASLDELAALRIARTAIDELLRSCVDQLRTDPQTSHSWSAIAYALGDESADAVRQRYGDQHKPDAQPSEKLVEAFWGAHTHLFQWHFVPIDFVYALYTEWSRREEPGHSPFEPKAFTRRLRRIETTGWTYTRSRSTSLMAVPEPLTQRIPHWKPAATNAGVYGMRRAKSKPPE